MGNKMYNKFHIDRAEEIDTIKELIKNRDKKYEYLKADACHHFMQVSYPGKHQIEISKRSKKKGITEENAYKE